MPLSANSLDDFKYSIPPRARIPSGRNVGTIDRIASASLAALLLGRAFRKRDPGTWPGLWPNIAASLPLLYRALTGHSFLYASLGLTTAGRSNQRFTKRYEQQMTSKAQPDPFDVQRAVTIACPRHEVFRFFFDFDERQALGPEFKRVVREDRQLDVWASDLPHERPIHLRFETLDVEEERLIQWRCTSAAGKEEAFGVMTFADAPGNRGTEVTVALRLRKRTPRFFGAASGTVVGTLFDEADRIVRKQLRQFKQTLEVGQVATAELRPKSPSTYREPPPLLGRRANPLYGGALHHTH